MALLAPSGIMNRRGFRYRPLVADQPQPFVVSINLTSTFPASPNFSFDSIPDYTNYVDPNIPYSLPLSVPARGRLATPYVSSISTALIRAVSNRSFLVTNSYGGLQEPYYYFELQKDGLTYSQNFYKQVLLYTDYKGNNYYDFELETTWTLSWNGTAWQLFGKANIGATAGVIKTYSGGSASVLPYPPSDSNDLDLLYFTPFTTPLIDSNMNGTSNQIYLAARIANNVYKAKTGSATLTQAGKAGLIFNFSQQGLSAGTPFVSADINNAYSNLFSSLYTFTGDFTHLPKEAYTPMPINLNTNGELSNLTSSVLSLDQTTTTLSNSDYNTKTYSIAASLPANTGSARREIRVSGLKNYDNTSFDISSLTFQIGTAQPSPVVSLSSNNTTPRDFFVAHVGATVFTRTQRGESDGIALWDSTRKLWAVAKMNTYIRYFGGKYEFIAINGTTILTRNGNNENRWLANSNACSPSVMPWNAVWQGDVASNEAKIIDVSKNIINAMQKPTTLKIDGSIQFPLYYYRTYDDYPIKSSQRQYFANGSGDFDFICGEYRKLVFKGKGGSLYYGDSGVDMIYNYAQNKWILTIYQQQYDYKGNIFRDGFKYEAPYSTAFPITFTYVGSENGATTNFPTLVVSKATPANFEDVYSLADVSYPTTIPVDSAFSSIW
jgi:hypothetical protein